MLPHLASALRAERWEMWGWAPSLLPLAGRLAGMPLRPPRCGLERRALRKLRRFQLQQQGHRLVGRRWAQSCEPPAGATSRSQNRTSPTPVGWGRTRRIEVPTAHAPLCQPKTQCFEQPDHERKNPAIMHVGQRFQTCNTQASSARGERFYTPVIRVETPPSLQTYQTTL